MSVLRARKEAEKSLEKEHRKGSMLFVRTFEKLLPGNPNIEYILKNNIIFTQGLMENLIGIQGRATQKEIYNYVAEILNMTVIFHKRYSEMTDVEQRVLAFHNDMDELIQKKLFLQNPALANRIACKKGCAGCCSQPIDVTKSESELLIKTAQANNVTINLEQLERQRYLTTANWTETLSLEQGSCVFLDTKEGICLIWEHRPSVCRNFFVADSSDHCNIFSRDTTLSPTIKTIYADVARSAFLAVDGGEVSMSNHLFENLSRGQ